MAAVVALALAAAVATGSGALGHTLGNRAALQAVMAGAGETGTGETGAGTGALPANDYLRGRAAYAAGDYAQATAHLRAAVPTHGEFARHWLALSLEAEGQPRAGRLALDLENPAELALYGDILLREWATADAADKEEYLARLQNEQPQWVLPYANRLIEAQHFEDAAAWAQAPPDFATSPDALVTLGNARYMQERFDEALALFEQAYTLRPDAISAYWYGTALAEGDQPERGAALLAEAVQAATPDTPLLPWMLRMMGVGQARAGRCAEAQAAFDRAAASDPRAENQTRVAEVRSQYRDQCQYEAALQAYAAGRYAEAVALFEAALPTYGDQARRQAALSLGAAGRMGEALAYLDLGDEEDAVIYGEILLHHWAAFSAAEKAAHLAKFKTAAPTMLARQAQGLVDLQAYADAETWAMAAPGYATDVAALLVLGQVAFHQGNLEAAAEWLAAAYTQREDTLTGYWYGRALGLGSDPDRGAAVLQKTAGAMAAGDALLSWVLRDLAVSLARGGRCAEAQAVFARAAASDSGAENQARVANAQREYGEGCVPR
jgi:tetratricopeptide (TPR) repeat protein